MHYRQFPLSSRSQCLKSLVSRSMFPLESRLVPRSAFLSDSHLQVPVLRLSLYQQKQWKQSYQFLLTRLLYRLLRTQYLNCNRQRLSLKSLVQEQPYPQHRSVRFLLHTSQLPLHCCIPQQHLHSSCQLLLYLSLNSLPENLQKSV